MILTFTKQVKNGFITYVKPLSVNNKIYKRKLNLLNYDLNISEVKTQFLAF